jgi:hypothetical protein
MKNTTWVLMVWFFPAIIFAQGASGQTMAAPGGAVQVGSQAHRAQSAPPAAPAQQNKVREAYGKLPLSFEQNRGQADASVKFLSRGSGYTLFLTEDGAVFAVRGSASAEDGDATTNSATKVQGEKAAGARLLPVSSAAATDGFKNRPTAHADTAVLRLKLRGANASAKVTGEDDLPGKSNYFIGNDPKKWQSNVPTYGKVIYEGVYPGIDLAYYGNQRQLEYDFIIAAGADARRIQFEVAGARSVRRDSAGDLVLKLREGEMRWHKPVAYQEDGDKRKEIAANYVVKGNQVTFEIGAYDRGKRLFIDPQLVYSTYLGGGDDDRAFGIALDSDGNIYVAGYTASSNFPTVNAVQPALGGLNDAFITKIDPVASALIYSTYLGGTFDDGALGLAVDSSGNAYLTGFTTSNNFPLANPLQSTNAGGQDAFLVKLDPLGSTLIYSTYLGGNDTDTGESVVADSLGNAFVSGYTYSTNFPTKNPLQAANAGSADVFLAKVDPTGSSLFYSTYLGGSGTDLGYGVAVDATGKAYVTGSTMSTDFPVNNALQSVAGGNGDAFISAISPLGSTLVYSTYLGGKNFDDGNSITVDAVSNVYVTGATASTDFPVAMPLQSTNSGGTHDAYVSEINPAGSSLVFSTYLGGTGDDVGLGIALDTSANIYVTGDTSSSNFPIFGAVQPTLGGGLDAFATVLTSSGASFMYSSFLGGRTDDVGRGIAVDSSGSAYVAGYTQSHNFPLVNALQTKYAGGSHDVFVSQFPKPQADVTLAPTALNFGNTTVGQISGPLSVTLTNSGSLLLSISSLDITGVDAAYFSETNTCGNSVPVGGSCTISITFSPQTRGYRSATLSISDNAPDSPQSVSLNGRGVVPLATLTSSALAFSTQLVFTASQPQSVTLTNTGLGTLFISSLTITGQYSESNNCGTSLSAGASCSITVTFKPITRGTLSGAVTITDVLLTVRRRSASPEQVRSSN